MTDDTGIGLHRAGAIVMVAILTLSVLAGGVALAIPADDLSYDGDTSAPNPYIDVDTMTVASHPMSEGTSHEDMAGYYDDNGDWVDDPEFVVNTTSDAETGDNVNPYSFDVTEVNADFLSEFPRTGTNDDGEQEASALDASEWSVDDSTGGTMTVSDTETASNVEAVNIAVTGQSADADVATASYSNWTSELDSDEDKRVLQLGVQVNSIDPGTTVGVNVTDESGDEKIVEIDPSGDATNDGVLASGTGSYVTQVKLSDLPTVGSGDWSNIESIDVQVHDGNADLSFSWIDLERKTDITLGEKMVTDSDGEYTETQEIVNVTDGNAIDVHSMETLGSQFDDAVINDVSFPAKYTASELQGEEADDGAYFLSWDSAEDFPAFDTVLNTTYRLSTHSAIDLSHSGMDLEVEQGFHSDRYAVAGYEEAVGDSSNLTDADLTDQTGSLASTGDVINFDSTVNSGDHYAVGFEIKLTDDEQSAIENTGGAAAPAGGGGGGWMSVVLSPFTWIAGGIGLIYSRFKGWI